MVHIKRLQENRNDIIAIIGEIDASSSIELDLIIAKSVGEGFSKILGFLFFGGNLVLNYCKLLGTQCAEIYHQVSPNISKQIATKFGFTKFVKLLSI